MRHWKKNIKCWNTKMKKKGVILNACAHTHTQMQRERKKIAPPYFRH